MTRPKPLDPLERQKGEPVRAWEARREYLTMGVGRNVREVGRRFDISLTTVGLYSSKWRWVESAEEYDAQRGAIAAQVAADREAAKVRANLDKLAEREQIAPDMAWTAAAASYNEMTRLLKERESGGQPTAQDIALMMRTFSTMFPMMERSMEMLRSLNGRAMPKPDDAPDAPSDDSGEATLEALRAYHAALEARKGK